MSGRALGALRGLERAKKRADAFLPNQSPRGAFTIFAEPQQHRCAALESTGSWSAKILNHAEGGVTKIYDRFALDPEKTVAMERWANHLRKIIAGDMGDNVVPMVKARFLRSGPS